MIKNITDQLINDLETLYLRGLTESDVHQLKNAVIDYLGCTFAGRKENYYRIRKDIHNFMCGQGVGIIGEGYSFSTRDAALFNGINSHKLELDDGHRVAMLHIGAPIFSALFPIAEKHKVEGKDFLMGALLAYEVVIRLGMSVQPSLKMQGFHATGVLGVVGAAVGVSFMLGYDKDKLKKSISYAATSSSGILGVIDDKSEFKPFNVGNSASQGVLASEMALMDYQAPYDILGGKRGLLKIMSKEIKYEFLDIEDNVVPMIHQIYRKPYASCRHCHPMTEAGILLNQRLLLDINKVKKIYIETYKLAIEGHDHKIILGENSAKMSIPYSVAIALKYGSGQREYYKDVYINNPEIREIMNKIEIVENFNLSNKFPQSRSAIVSLFYENGEVSSEFIEHPKGEPENPLSDSELISKFNSLCDWAGIEKSKIEKIISCVNNIETDLTQLINIINERLI